MQHTELAAWLRLALTPGVGNRTARRLLADCGLPTEIFKHPSCCDAIVSAAQGRALRVEPPELARALERTWQWLHAGTPHVRHTLLTLADAAYPAALLNTPDPPVLLYAMASASWLEQEPHFLSLPCLAMVGSRHPTAQGARDAHDFAHTLAQAGWCIVSGLAQGVDAAAHEGALQARPTNGRPVTIAVVGTGLDRVYPSAHRELAHRIARQGVLLSEFHLGTPPRADNFPKRNRIIAGLSLGTLVVEAAVQSGSLITARMAAEQGREVFAIPGSIHTPQSRGCHALIRQGAKLVETVEDILEELPSGHTTPIASIASIASTASTMQHSVQHTIPMTQPCDNDPLLHALGWGDSMGLDALQARTGMSTAALQVALLEHELNGQVMRLPGGRFQRLAQA